MSENEEPELAHCARCRRLYVRTKSHVCEKCYDMEESDFARVRAEIERDPHLTAEQAAALANVTLACVFRMLDEGLIASASDANEVVCGRCGSPAIAPRQRLCAPCLTELDRELTVELQQVRLRQRANEMKGTANNLQDAIESRRWSSPPPAKRFGQ